MVDIRVRKTMKKALQSLGVPVSKEFDSDDDEAQDEAHEDASESVLPEGVQFLVMKREDGTWETPSGGIMTAEELAGDLAHLEPGTKLTAFEGD